MPTVRPFWKRLESLFRSNGHHAERRTRAVDVVAAGEGNSRGAQTLTFGDVHGGAKPPNGSLLSIGGWRSSKTELREGYQRVIELMNAMERHFDRQDHRLEQLTGSLEKLTEILAPMVATQREQTGHMACMAEHITEADSRLANLVTTLRGLPAATQAQNETLRSLNGLLKGAAETDAEVTHSLDRFGAAVDTLRESGAVQVDTLNRLNHEQRESSKGLRAFVRSQNRRFLIALGIIATAAVAALAVIWATLSGLLA